MLESLTLSNDIPRRVAPRDVSGFFLSPPVQRPTCIHITDELKSSWIERMNCIHFNGISFREKNIFCQFGTNSNSSLVWMGLEMTPQISWFNIFTSFVAWADTPLGEQWMLLRGQSSDKEKKSLGKPLSLVPLCHIGALYVMRHLGMPLEITLHLKSNGGCDLGTGLNLETYCNIMGWEQCFNDWLHNAGSGIYAEYSNDWFQPPPSRC